VNNKNNNDDDVTRKVTPTFAGPYCVWEALLANYMHSVNGGTAKDGQNPHGYIQLIAINHVERRKNDD